MGASAPIFFEEGAAIKSTLRYIQQFSTDVRLITAALAMLCTLYLLLSLSWLALVFFPVSVLLCWDALRHATVWPAFEAFKAHRHDRLRALLQGVRWPGLLNGVALAYYNWLKGIDDMAQGRLGAAKVHLLAAASGPIRSESDRSLIHCLLAELALQQGERDIASEHLRHAAALAPEGRTRQMVAKLQARMNS